jgi:C4-dicarboxylate transporter DctM subunit
MLVGVLLVSFFLLLFIGVPISFSLSISSFVAVAVTGTIPVINLVQKTFRAIDSFTLLAIPFFVFAGNVMARGGVSKRLTDIAATIVGRLPGGLAHVATLSSTFFGAISGSAPATTSAIGAVMVPEMEKHGYDKAFTAAVVAASGTIGLIIPPSNTMVMYGTLANASVGKMFIGGIVPGLIMTAVIIGISFVTSKKRGYQGTEKPTLQSVWNAFKNGIWALLMPVIILGGIYSGLFTPTEAAAVAVAYGIVVSAFVYRNLDWKGFLNVIYASASSTASILFLVANAHIFSYLLSSENIPQKLATFMMSLTTNPLIIKLLIMVVLLIAGCFLDNAVAIVLLTPIFVTVVQQLGIDICYFGVLMVFILAIGQVTPPVGLCLFVACDIGKVKIEAISREVMPYVLGLIGVALLLVFFPGLITWLPSLTKL